MSIEKLKGEVESCYKEELEKQGQEARKERERTVKTNKWEKKASLVRGSLRTQTGMLLRAQGQGPGGLRHREHGSAGGRGRGQQALAWEQDKASSHQGTQGRESSGEHLPAGPVPRLSLLPLFHSPVNLWVPLSSQAPFPTGGKRLLHLMQKVNKVL